MNEEFEKLLMIQVRGQLLINWLSALKELLTIPFDEYSRFHRKIFSILIVELMNDGLKYVSKQMEIYEKQRSMYLSKFFSIIYTGVSQLKNAITDDEYIYLYHLRNCAGHIFPVGYDYIDLYGNVKKNNKVTMQTKSGHKKMPLDKLDVLLKKVCQQYDVDDKNFLSHIYTLSKDNLTSMFEELSEHQRNHLLI